MTTIEQCWEWVLRGVALRGMSPFMKDYLTKQVEDRRAKLQKLERDKIAMAAELRAYEDMLQHVSASESGDEGTPDEDVASALAALSPSWRRVLGYVAFTCDDVFTPSDVLAAAKQVKVETTDVNVRSQLSIYTSKGIVTRLGGGRYRFSGKAAEIFEQESREKFQPRREPEPAPAAAADIDDEIPF